MQQASFPLTLAIQLYYRGKSDFFNKCLSVMQAVPCVVTQRHAVHLTDTQRDVSVIPGRPGVLDHGFQSKHLD